MSGALTEVNARDVRNFVILGRDWLLPQKVQDSWLHFTYGLPLSLVSDVKIKNVLNFFANKHVQFLSYHSNIVHDRDHQNGKCFGSFGNRNLAILDYRPQSLTHCHWQRILPFRIFVWRWLSFSDFLFSVLFTIFKRQRQNSDLPPWARSSHAC